MSGLFWGQVPSMAQISSQLAYVSASQQIQHAMNLSNLYLRPKLDSYSIFDISKLKEIRGIGYDIALSEVAKWKQSSTHNNDWLNEWRMVNECKSIVTWYTLSIISSQEYGSSSLYNTANVPLQHSCIIGVLMYSRSHNEFRSRIIYYGMFFSTFFVFLALLCSISVFIILCCSYSVVYSFFCPYCDPSFLSLRFTIVLKWTLICIHVSKRLIDILSFLAHCNIIICIFPFSLNLLI